MRPTTIMNVEVSALCNLNCVYCMAPTQGAFRRTGLMPMDVFEKVMGWVKYFVQQGTQTELNLFGTGEPLMHPELPRMVQMARKVLPLCLPVHINTNGGLMTEELAWKLKMAGISQIDITGHNHLFTARTIRLLRKLKIEFRVTYDFTLLPNNWAGQVDWYESEVTYPCPWLYRGQLYAAWNGDILQCCFDAKASNVLGSIMKHTPDEIIVKPFDLCKKCHQTVPEEKNNAVCIESKSP